jgi:hypothetical protein
MGLINLHTDLKSLKFGHDRIGGGSSNQPYITSPIPDKIGEYGFLNTDFLLRGGSKSVTDSLKDVERLGKYFTDVRNPSGLLFVAKQNLLSRTAVRTQASGFLLNEGAYTPLSTLIEAGGVAFGLHVNKQGLNPFGGFGGIKTYDDLVNPNLGFNLSIKNVKINRLVDLYKSNINPSPFAVGKPKTKLNLDPILYKYGGGPGSTLGIGKTYIRKATNTNEGLQITFPQASDSNIKISNSKENLNLTRHVRASEKYEFYLDSSFDPLLDNGFSNDGKLIRIFGPLDNNQTLSTNPVDSFSNQNGTFTYSQEQLNNIPQDELNNGNSSYIGGINRKNNITTPGDFRKLLRNNLTIDQKEIQQKVGNLINAPDYSGADAKNIEKRVKLGDPGNRNGKELISYTSGSFLGAASIEGNGSYDKINASKVGVTSYKDDLVKFRIEVVDNDTPSKNTNIQFRAFLNTISDQYMADWNPTKYLGRGENFYTYGGFDRKVSLSWTVAAQSKIELIPMYKKLNYLASVCAPDYSTQGYMRGNLVKLTIGGYFYEQYGIMTGLNYEMNDDSATWEIGINDEGKYDSTVKELPHLIKVSSFNFIPIHNFVPRKVQNGTENFGTKERFIALKATDSNYDLK